MCVCRSTFVTRFFSTIRESRGSMDLPHAAHVTAFGFLKSLPRNIAASSVEV
jgi:hypothetical protein